jgi:hypothetical protein
MMAATAPDTRLTRVEEVCAALSAAAAAMSTTAPPDPSPLPMEPARPYPPDALRDAAAKGASDVDAYRILVFVLRRHLHHAADAVRREEPPTKQGEPGRTGGAVPDPRTIDPLDDFSNWSAYVERTPPVLMVRVTPRLVEGFWTRVARGAARTQGVSLPPIKRFKPGFARLQAFCGDTEVTPIHPFKLVQRVSESEAVYEGLYVFAPEALGPSCGSVRLVLYSETDGKGDTRVVDPGIVQRIWDDFAPYRQLVERGVLVRNPDGGAPVDRDGASLARRSPRHQKRSAVRCPESTRPHSQARLRSRARGHPG